LNEALAAQARRIEHVVFAGCTHAPAVDLAEKLVDVIPSGLNRIFYSDNGSTAVEVALKLAVQYWRNQGKPARTKFVALHHAYHGDTVGAMSASEDSLFTGAFASMLFSVERVHAPYCYRCPLGLTRATCSIDCLGDLEKKLAENGDSIAAVLIEPMLQGAGGMIVWPREFLAGVRRLCDRYGVLMIADEVLTGFGRTGKMFACEHADIRPDLMCLSKALTGGYLPMGVTAATDAIYDAFLSDDRAKTFFHGHSYTANPLACAVALASLDLFRETDALGRVAALDVQLRAGFEEFRSLPNVGDVRVIGGVAALELKDERMGNSGYLANIGPKLTAAFLARGLLLRPLGNIVYFMPPYAITEKEAAWAMDQIGEVLQNI
jgi:adenosylmethionine-8-amino-7-oxononanoate aminotransferase